MWKFWVYEGVLSTNNVSFCASDAFPQTTSVLLRLSTANIIHLWLSQYLHATSQETWEKYTYTNRRATEHWREDERHLVSFNPFCSQAKIVSIQYEGTELVDKTELRFPYIGDNLKRLDVLPGRHEHCAATLFHGNFRWHTVSCRLSADIDLVWFSFVSAWSIHSPSHKHSVSCIGIIDYHSVAGCRSSDTVGAASMAATRSFAQSSQTVDRMPNASNL